MASSNGDQYRAELSTWLDQAVRTVREDTQYLESEFFVPFWRKYFAFGQRNPFTTILLTTFVVVSFLPVLSFCAFGVLVLSSFTFIALVSAASAAAWVLSIAALGLFAVLGGSFTICFFLSSSAYAAFLQYRLFSHILDSANHGGTKGAIWQWAQETYTRLGLPRSPPSPPSPTSSSPSTAAPSYQEFIAAELKAAENWKAANGY